MAFKGKIFTIQRKENFEDFVTALGISDDKVQRLFQCKPDCKNKNGGNNYVFTIIADPGDIVCKFKADQDFANVLWDIYANATVTMDPNKATQIIPLENGSILIVKKENTDCKFSEDALPYKWDVICPKIYK